jgi:hypothetical protein
MKPTPMRLCDDHYAAEYLGVSTRFLQYDRTHRRTIPYVKINSFVRYDLDDLENFITSVKQGGAYNAD